MVTITLIPARAAGPISNCVLAKRTAVPLTVAIASESVSKSAFLLDAV